MVALSDIAVRIEPILGDVSGSVVFDRFSAAPDLMAIGVVNADNVPIGLVERNQFSLKMAGAYGRALYGGRPVANIMDRTPLIVDHAAVVSDFAGAALKSQPSDLLKGIIVTRDGRYAGVATITAVLKAISDQSLRDAEELAAASAELTRAKSEAQAANSLLKEALDAMSEGVAVFNDREECVLWNSKYASSHRRSLDVLREGVGFAELLRHGVQNQQYVDAIGREEEWLNQRIARRAAPVDRISEEQQLPDGRFIRVEDSRLPSGGSISVAVDVTDIKRQGASFRFLFDSNPVPLAVFDRETLRFLAVNAAFCSQYGYTAGALLEASLLDLMPPDDRAATEARLKGQSASGAEHSREGVHLTSTGDMINTRTYRRPLNYGGRDATLVAALDVTPQHKAEASLLAALEQAETANRAKSEFLANMSHEIRTPLNGILGIVSVLARTKLNAQQQDMVGIVETSSRTLQVLLDDLLDIAKIESGLLELNPHVMLPAEVANQVRGLFDATAQDKGLTFEVRVDEGAYSPVLADRTRLAQIITNLCSNALKFTDEGGVILSINTSQTAETQRLHIAVQDTGIGISEAGRRRLFERFSQADGSITRRFGGTGLGLAISQQLAHMMGGEIAVTSVPGKGSTFALTVEFPRVEVNEAQSTGGAADGDGPSPWAATDGPARVRVLLVEDHPINRKVVEMILADMVDLTTAEDGLQGVEAEASSHFDLILMDMQMPVMDGLTATKTIRERERRAGDASTPIIVLTANVLREHVQACLDAGADSHLCKPITASTLIEAMETALAEADARALQRTEQAA